MLTKFELRRIAFAVGIGVIIYVAIALLRQVGLTTDDVHTLMLTVAICLLITR